MSDNRQAHRQKQLAKKRGRGQQELDVVELARLQARRRFLIGGAATLPFIFKAGPVRAQDVDWCQLADYYGITIEELAQIADSNGFNSQQMNFPTTCTSSIQGLQTQSLEGESVDPVTLEALDPPQAAQATTQLSIPCIVSILDAVFPLPPNNALLASSCLTRLF